MNSTDSSLGADALRRGRRWGFVVGWLAIVAIHVVGRVGAYCSPIRGDSYLYGAVGYRIALGDRMYAEVSDVKPPIVYWLYAASYTVLPPGRLSMAPVDTLASGLGYWAVFAFARRLYGTGVGMIVTTAFAMAANAFCVLDFATGGFGLSEGYMILPAAMAAHSYARGLDSGRLATWVVCGVWLGLELMVKQSAAALVVAILLHGVWSLRRGGFREMGRFVGGVALGGGMVGVAFACVFAWQGTLRDAVSAMGPAAVRMTRLETGFPAGLDDVTPLWGPIGWTVLGGALLALGSRRGVGSPGSWRDTSLLVVWLVMECLTLVVAPLRSYHYYVIACLPLVLLSGAFWERLVSMRDGGAPARRARIAVGAVLSLAAARPTVDAVIPVTWARWRSYDRAVDQAYFMTVTEMDLSRLGEAPLETSE
jgi:hypothetical protein